MFKKSTLLFSSLLIALIFVFLPQAFAGGVSHLVLGTVHTSTGDVPTADNLTITAYITVRPDDIMTYPPSKPTKIEYYESTATWIIEVSGFAGIWAAGETLHVDFHDPLPAGSGESNSVEVVLNNDPSQNVDDVALPVELSAFGAIWNPNDSIKIFWEAKSQQQNLGWNVYRSETKDGKFVKINGGLIKGAGTTANSMKYSFIDKDAEKGKVYYYYLEDISFSGEKHRTPLIKTNLVNKVTSWGEIKRSALR